MVHLVADKEDYDSQMEAAGEKLVVIDFFATWCGPCKQIAPFIEKLEQENSGNVIFLKVDVDENEELAQTFNVSCMPTFILLKNRNKVDEFSGANQEKLREMVEKYK